jgi:hypothetical protein
MTVDDNPQIASAGGVPKTLLRIRTPSGVNCSSCPDFKVLADPLKGEEWTCDSCVAGGSPDPPLHAPRH